MPSPRHPAALPIRVGLASACTGGTAVWAAIPTLAYGQINRAQAGAGGRANGRQFLYALLRFPLSMAEGVVEVWSSIGY